MSDLKPLIGKIAACDKFAVRRLRSHGPVRMVAFLQFGEEVEKWSIEEDNGFLIGVHIETVPAKEPVDG